MKYVLLFGALLVCAGCAYTMSARLPAAVETVHIRPFANRSVEPYLGTGLTGRVKEELIKRTGINLRDPDSAECTIFGTVLSIGGDVISEDSAGAVLSERVTVNVNVTIKHGEQPAESFTLTGVAVAERTSLVSRDVQLGKALQDVARQVVNRLINSKTEVQNNE